MSEGHLTRRPWGTAWTHFMQREYSWHRATGTLTTQEGNARSREWLTRSRVRDKSCLACGESSTHLQRHTPTHRCIKHLTWLCTLQQDTRSSRVLGIKNEARERREADPAALTPSDLFK